VGGNIGTHPKCGGGFSIPLNGNGGHAGPLFSIGKKKKILGPKQRKRGRRRSLGTGVLTKPKTNLVEDH